VEISAFNPTTSLPWLPKLSTTKSTVDLGRRRTSSIENGIVPCCWDWPVKDALNTDAPSTSIVNLTLAIGGPRELFVEVVIIDRSGILALTGRDRAVRIPEMGEEREASIQTRLGAVRERVRMWVTGCGLNAGVVEISNHIESGGHRCVRRNANHHQAG